MGLFQAVGNPGEFIPVSAGSLTDGTYASATVVVTNGAITSVSGGSAGSLTNGTFTLATVTVTGGQISSITAGAAGTLAQAYNSGSAGPQVMALDSTRLGVLIRDNATPIGSTLFGVQNSGGTTKFLDVLAGSLTSAYPRPAAATVGSSAATQALATKTINATAPTGIALNDLLVVSVIFFMNGSSAAQTITTPAGWVQIRKDNDAANFDGALYYKVATSTEVGASTFAFTIGGAPNADYISAEVWRIPTGSYAGTPTLSGFALNGGFVNSVVIGSITPTTNGILLLAAQEVLGGGSIGFTTPTNFVVDDNVNSSGNRNYSGFQSQQLPPGATGSITVAKPSGGTSKMLAHMVFIANTADSAVWSYSHNNTVPLDGGFLLQNTAAATASYQQASPSLQLTGAAWNTTSNASHAVDFLLQSQPATGNPVSSTLQLYSRINAGSWASVFSLTDTGALTLTQGAGWIASMLTLTGIANTTNLTASTEFIDANFNFARTVTWATGALTTQRAFVIQAPTYAFAAASTLTTAVTLDITGAPLAGTNATFTNQLGIRLGGTYSPAVATNTSLIYINSTFSPSASSPSFAGVHINPTISGTSSGKAAGLAVATRTNTLTGGTINLVDFGTTTTDYYTGYTSRLSVGTDGTTVFNVTTGTITLKAGPILDFNGSGTIIDELVPSSTGTSIVINAGQGQGTRTAGGLFSVQNNATDHFKVAFDGSTTIAQRASWSANSLFTVTGAANSPTNLAAGVELSDVKFNLARTVTWATGALTTQRAFVIQAPTYAFAAASTLTTAATFAITGAPVAGLNATISNPYTLWIQSGTSQFDGTIINSTATAITLSNITPSITLSGTNAAFTFTTNKNAGDTGTDFTINSPVTRTAGNLFIVSNNAVAQLTLTRAGSLTIANDFTTGGNVNIGAGNQVVVTSTNAGLFLNGNKNAADTGNDVSIGSALATTRTAGNLAQYINANVQKAYVTFGGLLGWISGNTQTTVGAAGAASALPATPTGYLKIDVNGTTQVVPYYAAV